VRAIVGDLRTAQLPHSQYDVIYNSFVLEHVAGAEDVLVNFTRWVRPGGIIILRIPDPNSAYGFMARWTPFKVHVLFYRYVVGIKDAGRRGFGPYPTVYDPIVSREGVRRFCAEHGLVIREELGNGSYHQGRGLFKYALPCVARIINWLSLGRIHSDFTSLTYVVEKPLQSRKPN
jgi:SAM-dependent methyltransferase